MHAQKIFLNSSEKLEGLKSEFPSYIAKYSGVSDKVSMVEESTT